MVYSTIQVLKQRGHTIVSRKAKYFITIVGTALEITPTRQPTIHARKNGNSNGKTPPLDGAGIKALYKESIAMPQGDQTDFDDLIKKSIFYKLSAESLLRANQAVTQLREEVS